MTFSISPDNKKFKIPDEKMTLKEISNIKYLCALNRKKGKKIVVVQGLGFVGAINSAVIADTQVDNEIPYFVIGVDLPTKNSYWKIPIINRGESPVEAEDPEVKLIFHRAVHQKNNLHATWVSQAHTEADIILIDINLDVEKIELGKAVNSRVKINQFKEAITDIGGRMRPDALLIIETTVPPGTIEKIVAPIISEKFRERKIDLEANPPLIAHSYERVMPGKEYIKSIKQIRRTYSALNEKASEEARKFLSNIIDVKNYPLWRLPNTTASEIAKVMENSYRAMNIAFIYEWTLLAEDLNVNLFEVVDSIKVRKGTHDNMMYPGFGVGGYCLPKDPLLAEWASREIFKREKHLNFSVQAVDINDLMPLHTFELLMRGMNNILKGKKVAILGASYRKDVDDTRNSPSIVFYDEVLKNGGKPAIHDPYVKVILQREDIVVDQDLDRTLKLAEAVVLVINHGIYLSSAAQKIASNAKKNACIVDAFNILSDQDIKSLKEKGFLILGVGKGHINNL